MCSRPTYVITKKLRKLAIRGQNCRLFIVANCVDALVKAQSQTAAYLSSMRNSRGRNESSKYSSFKIWTTRMRAYAQRDGRPRNIGDALC